MKKIALVLGCALLAASAQAGTQPIVGTVYVFTAPSHIPKGTKKLSFTPPSAIPFMVSFSATSKPSTKKLDQLHVQIPQAGVEATVISASKSGPNVGMSAILPYDKPPGEKWFFEEAYKDRDDDFASTIDAEMTAKIIAGLKKKTLPAATDPKFAERRALLDSIGKGLR